MKKLSIEQKAKRYDEAIKRAKGVIEQNPLMEYLKKGIEYILPELKESEDERIRKAIKKALQVRCDGSRIISDEPVTLEEAIAWLEKQGEQKPTVIIPKFRVGDEIKTSNEESLTITKIDEKGYWSEDLFICRFDDADKWELVEQNPAWSEEDEEIHRKCICAMRASACGFPEEEKFVEQVDNWLKSLKDRVQPQPKQEWSEEDENIIRLSIENLTELEDKYGKEYGKVGDCINWLESLRPQNTWKPSEEQLEALDSATENCAYSEYQDCLKELIRQLKKLREE